LIKIAVIDGQGGGIGSLIVKRLKDNFGDRVDVIGLGTNSQATVAMLKARANKGATGENAIIINSSKVDVILGSISILMANSMMGEMTLAMAAAISSSSAKKILIPLNQEGLALIGVKQQPLPHMVDDLIIEITKILEEKNV
jgi:NAD(P)-dependent dehydrogenase (short-subunit alcohol dehydrogenase family)